MTEIQEKEIVTCKMCDELAMIYCSSCGDPLCDDHICDGDWCFDCS